MTERILVIKHGALGDFVLATGPFKAIRAHHPGAHITLMTTKPFAGFAAAMGLFDDIWIDDKPKPWNLGRWFNLRRRLRESRFDRVYDLQHTDRTHSYFRLMGSPKPEWSGIAPGASHPHSNPNRDRMHTIERQAEQLAMAGIADTPPTDLGWLKSDITRFDLPRPFALLVPGAAPHRPDKRWPAERYAALARTLSATGVLPVLIGAAAEKPIMEAIRAKAPQVRDLGGQTSFADIAELGRHAALAVGNDTGPMHFIAAVGCPSVVLFSAASRPAETAPRGPKVAILQESRLADLAEGRVIASLATLVPDVVKAGGTAA